MCFLALYTLEKVLTFMEKNQKTVRLLLLSLLLVTGSLSLQPGPIVQAKKLQRTVSIQEPRRETFERMLPSPYQTEHKYAARVNDGLIGFFILIVVMGIGLWLIKVMTRKEFEKQQSLEEEKDNKI